MNPNLRKLTIVTSLITVAPMILGAVVYNQLPAKIATHFGFNGQPNQYSPKGLMLFGFPILMLLLQLLLTVVYSLNASRKGRARRFEPILFSIVPLLSVVLYIVTVMIGLGHAMDVRRIAVFLIALIFIGMGNYLPTITWAQQKTLGKYQYPRPKDEQTWQKVSHRGGYAMVSGGVLMLISLFFGPTISVIMLIITILALLVGMLSGFKA